MSSTIAQKRHQVEFHLKGALALFGTLLSPGTMWSGIFTREEQQLIMEARVPIHKLLESIENNRSKYRKNTNKKETTID